MSLMIGVCIGSYRILEEGCLIYFVGVNKGFLEEVLFDMNLS